MEYTVKQLADMAGVSARTLRYYDQTGLLSPKRISSSGYRIYGEAEVDALQQILFYRAMGVELTQIRALICAPGFDRLSALENHLAALREKRIRIDKLIENADKTIAHLKGEIEMNDTEKFEGFKRSLIEENDKKYGAEIREKYGEATVEQSNAKMMNLTQEQYEEWTQLEREVLERLAQAFETGDPAGELARQTCELHKRWLSFCGAPYSKEYQRSLGQMYAADPRFSAYYEKAGPGCAAFLRDAIEAYCGQQ